MGKKEPGPFEQLLGSLIMLFLLWLLFRWLGGGAKPVNDVPEPNPSPAIEAPVQNTTPSGNGNVYRTAPARPNNDNKIAEANVQGIRAYTCAIGKMKSLLKSPSSADFPWTADGAALLDNGKIMVNGHVDAENSYGAKIRTNFTCVVEKPDDSGCLDDLSRVDCSTSG